MYRPNDQTLDLLGRIRGSFEEDRETIHSGDPSDALDLYLNGIVSALVSEHGMSEESAIELIFALADKLEGRGLPPFPSEDASPDEVAVWLGTAGTIGFNHYALMAAG